MSDQFLVNYKDAMLRVDNDKELYDDLVNMFFDDPQFKPEDLENLLSAGKNEEAAKLAHLLKGVAGTLGADQLFAACKTLDDILRGRIEGDITAAKDAVIYLFDETSKELQRYLKEGI
ncbi:MAG: Hpt domain-containing protein [Treponema sp.]|nr:Hpt domain-containing protein [Candidatus Treponema caballi]